MKCIHCDEKAVITGPARCKKHFVEEFEKRTWDTIERFNLIREGESICVAASGGKDSLALLHILSQKHSVHALAVDEGIPGYRDQTLLDLQEFCTQANIPLKVVTFADVDAKPLSEQNPERPCSVCGVLRRKALLKFSAKYDIIATGHNLDDECQSIMMNVLRNQVHLLARLGPRTTAMDGIAARIKPFYLTPEREVRAYCLLKNITTNFVECPNARASFRFAVGESLNDLELKQPESKLNIVEHFLKQKYTDDRPKGICSRCGSPASRDLCRGCRFVVVES